jgi:pSer/pThr/pTyr-binding forkhead associated (FHA) protein
MEITPMATLLILKATAGDLTGQEFAITGPAHCVLGRSRACALRLPGDATVSRQHCLIEVERDGVWVQDLGSLNGTLVNGEKIGQRERNRNGDATMVQPPKHSLQNGDELRICNNAFRVSLADGDVVQEDQVAAHGSSATWALAVC